MTVAVLVAAPAAWSAAAPMLRVSVPRGQTVAALRNQAFVERLTCARACDVTTLVSVALDDARRLGYDGAAHSRITIASSFSQLDAGSRSDVGLVLNADGKAMLRTARGPIRVVATLTANPHKKPAPRWRARWTAVLK